jgi:hypothetical protein
MKDAKKFVSQANLPANIAKSASALKNSHFISL